MIALFKVNIFRIVHKVKVYNKYEGKLKRSSEKQKLKKLLKRGHWEGGKHVCIY